MKEIKKKLNIEQWREVGKLMRDFEIRWVAIYGLMAGRISQKFHNKKWDNISDLIKSAKVDFEGMMDEDCPDEWTEDIFFGGADYEGQAQKILKEL